MSGTDDDPGVYTLPEGAFRVGSPASASAPSAGASDAASATDAGGAPAEGAPAGRAAAGAPGAPAADAPDAGAAPEGTTARRASAHARESARGRGAASVRRRRGGDIALTIVLLVLLAAGAVVASAYGVVLGIAAGSCGSGGRLCQGDLRDVGVWMSLTTPWLVVVLSSFLGVLLLVLRRRGFWVPLVGAALMLVLWFLGALLVWAAI